jgi:hypothetical protein
MSKRRTRKEKLSAKHNFAVSWNPEPKEDHSEPNVKRQFPKPINKTSSNTKTNKLVNLTDKSILLATTQKDLAKSLLFAASIIASEVVIYLVWNK